VIVSKLTIFVCWGLDIKKNAVDKLMLIVLIFIVQVGICQNQLLLKRNKVGLITASGEKILPPRFDSLLNIHSDVVCVKKRRGWGYYDLQSKKYILRPKYDSITPFKHGLGFYYNSGYWDNIERDKTRLLYRSFKTKPYVIGNYIVVPKEGLLYDFDKNLLSSNVSRLDLYLNGAIIETSIEKEYVEKKLLFFKKKTQFTDITCYFVKDEADEKIKNIPLLKRDSLFTYGFYKDDTISILIDNQRGVVSERAANLTKIKDNLFFFLEDVHAYLIDGEGAKSVPYSNYLLKGKYDIGLFKNGDADIILHEDQTVVSTVKRFHSIVNDELVLVKSDSLFDLLNIQGELLLKHVSRAIPRSDGYYEVRRGPFYKILDPDDKHAFGKSFVPIYYGTDHYVKRYGFLKLSRSKRERYGKVSKYNNVSEDNYAVVALPLVNNPADTLRKDDFEVTYNYLKRDGSLLNNKEYEECQPFFNGKGFVKLDNEKYVLVDETGKENRRKIYYDVTYLDDKGIFIVSVDAFEKGIMNKKYEWVYPPEYSYFHTKDGVMYGKKRFGEEEVIEYD
jgi:hypothetical protein